MPMKKMLCLLIGLILIPSITIGFAGLYQEARAEGLYNAREELEYTLHASRERQEERRQQTQFLQYQQQQHMEHQRLMDQQSMYDQTHRQGSQLSKVLLWERP
jgi:hypothetical protein